MTLTRLILLHPFSLVYLPISLRTDDHLTVGLCNGPSSIVIQQTEMTSSSAHVPNFVFCSCLRKCCPQLHPETATKWTMAWVLQFGAWHSSTTHMLLLDIQIMREQHTHSLYLSVLSGVSFCLAKCPSTLPTDAEWCLAFSQSWAAGSDPAQPRESTQQNDTLKYMPSAGKHFAFSLNIISAQLCSYNCIWLEL